MDCTIAKRKHADAADSTGEPAERVYHHQRQRYRPKAWGGKDGLNEKSSIILTTAWLF